MPPTNKPNEVLLSEFQFVQDIKPRRRLILGVDGREKHGKTNFCFTAPDPIVYFDFNLGTEGVVEKHMKDRHILKSRPFVVRTPDAVAEDDAAAGKAEEKHWEAEWDRFHDAYIEALTTPVLRWQNKVADARSIIIDTGTEMYELLRLAKFKKIMQVASYFYRKTNAIMLDLIKHAMDNEVNVIFTHKLKAEWAKGKGDEAKQAKTGVYERQGWEEMAHAVQANVFCYRAPQEDAQDQRWRIKVGTGEPHDWMAEARDANTLGFRLRVLDSRHNPNLNGFELQDEMITFPKLAAMIVEDSVEEDWQ